MRQSSPTRFTRPRLSSVLCGGALLFGCSEAYEPDPQLWPLSSASAGTGGNTGSEPGSTGGSSGATPTPTAGTDSVVDTGGSSGLVGAAGTETVGSGGGGTANTAGAGGTANTAGAGGTSTGGNTGMAGMAGKGGGGGGAGTGGATTSGACLNVSMTTTAVPGNYSPRHVGAIWVSTESGAFVKSLNVWAASRIKYLTAWNNATKAAGVAGNKVDAVTAATLCPDPAKCKMPVPSPVHNVSWDCMNYKHEPVPDGTYKVNFEATAKNGTGPTYAVTFVKGPMAASLTPPDSTPFTAIKLDFAP